MRSLAGPFSSGKTRTCLAEFRTHLRRDPASAVLITPSASLAEHLRNEVACEGFVFPPGCVTSFSAFIRSLVDVSASVSRGYLEILLKRILCDRDLEVYNRLAEAPGFASTLADTIQDLGNNTASLQSLEIAGADSELRQVYSRIQNELALRGKCFHRTHLEHAAVHLRENGSGSIRFAYAVGFDSLDPPEIEVLRALAQHAALTVAIEDVAEAASQPPAISIVRANTIDGECEEIARRCVQMHAEGGDWRRIGIVLRSPEIYAPALRAAFDRFHIPARFHLSTPLADVAASRYLMALVRAAMAGWDHVALLPALRNSMCPLARHWRSDFFEHHVIRQFPSQGLAPLRELFPEGADFFDRLEAIQSWVEKQMRPSAFARRFEGLTPFCAPPAAITTPEDALLWRQQSQALEGWTKAAKETAEALGDAESISCAEWMDYFAVMIKAKAVTPIDRRSDAIHVLDAFEARHWQWPVCFVPGMLERQFPRYITPDPILPDFVRLGLQSQSVAAKTSRERAAEEDSMFEIAATRGSDRVILSYPRLNAKGEETLPSFFLSRFPAAIQEEAVPCQPRPVRPRGQEPSPSIGNPALVEALAAKHTTVAATAIETFLQCPFQFFVQRTLRLKPPPDLPADRNGLPLQGSITHAALEVHYREGIPIEQAFDRAFQEACQKRVIPDTWHREFVRLDMLNNLILLTEDERMACPAGSLHEESFTLPLEGVTITGKIDRMDIDAHNRALVIDYKYRSKSSMEQMKKQWEKGALVQSGLYLKAAAQKGYDLAGMTYCGFKREVKFSGWVTGARGKQLSGECSSGELLQVMEASVVRTLESVASIREGRIAPEPLDEQKCRWCDFSSACGKEVYAVHHLLNVAEAAH